MDGTKDSYKGKPLKILVVTSDRYPPKRPAAKAIFGEEFARRGHRVDWLMQADDAETTGGTLEFGHGQVFLAPTHPGNSRLKRIRKYFLDLVNDFRVFSLARQGEYDIIQVKDKYIAAVLGLLAARVNGCKFCYWLAYPHAEANLYSARHGIARYPLFYRFRGWYQSYLLYKILLPRADHIFVQSEQMRSDIADKGIDAESMTPVPGSLNLDSVPYDQDDSGRSPNKNILYVGTLIRNRHLDFIIRVFAKVLERVPGARLQFVGKGASPEDEELLHEEIAKQNIDPDTVEFVGYVPIDRVWQYIGQAAVCLSPYYPSFELTSTSPTKLIEYMAMARPIVANVHPEQSIVISQSKCGLCVPWEERAFADAIVALLEDTAAANEMGRSGRQWVVRNRTNAFMADLVEAQYFECLQSSNSRGGRNVTEDSR